MSSISKNYKGTQFLQRKPRKWKVQLTKLKKTYGSELVELLIIARDLFTCSIWTRLAFYVVVEKGRFEMKSTEIELMWQPCVISEAWMINLIEIKSEWNKIWIKTFKVEWLEVLSTKCMKSWYSFSSWRWLSSI